MSITSISLANLQAIRSNYIPKSSNFAAKYDNAVSLAPPNFTVAELMTAHVTKGMTTILLFTPLDLILIGCPCADIVTAAAFLTGTSSPLSVLFSDVNVIQSIRTTANLVNTRQKLYLYLQGKMVTNIFSLVNSNASLAYTETWYLNLDTTNQSTKTDPFNLPLQKTNYISGTTAPNTGTLKASDIIPDILENLGFKTSYTLAQLEDSTTAGVMDSLIQLSKSFRMLPYFTSNGTAVLSTSSSLDDLTTICLLSILNEGDALSNLGTLNLSSMYVSHRINLLLEMNAITLTSYDSTILTTFVASSLSSEGYKFTLTDIILFWMVIQENKDKFEELKLISTDFLINQGVNAVVNAGMPISMLKLAGFSVQQVISSGVLQSIVSPSKLNVLSVPKVYTSNNIMDNTNFTYQNSVANMADASNAYINKLTHIGKNTKYYRLTSAARIGALSVAPDNSLIGSSSIPETLTLLGSPPASGSTKLNVSGTSIAANSNLYNYNFPLLTTDYLKGPNSLSNIDSSYVNQNTGVNGLFDMNSDVITGISRSFTNSTDAALNFKWNPYKYYFGNTNLEFTGDTTIKTAYEKAHVCHAASSILKDISDSALADASMNDLLSDPAVTARIKTFNTKVDISNTYIGLIKAIATAASGASNKITAIDVSFDGFKTSANGTITYAPKSHSDLISKLRTAGPGSYALSELEDNATDAISNLVASSEEKWLGSFYAGFETAKINSYLTSIDTNDVTLLPIKTSYGLFTNCASSVSPDASFNLKIDSTLIDYINNELNKNNNSVTQTFLPNVFLHSVASQGEGSVDSDGILPDNTALSATKDTAPARINAPQELSSYLISPTANSTLEVVISGFKAAYPEFKTNNIRLEYKQSTISEAGKYNFVTTSNSDKLSGLPLSNDQQQELKEALIIRFLAVYLNPKKLSITEILSVLDSRYKNSLVRPRSSTTYNPTALAVLKVAFKTTELVHRNSGIPISILKTSFKYTPFQLFSGVTADVSRNVFGQVFYSASIIYDASNINFNEPWKNSDKLFTGYTFRELYNAPGGYSVAELNKDFNVFSLMFGSFFQTNDVSSSVIVTGDMNLTSGAFTSKSFPISWDDRNEKNLYVEANAQLNGLTWYELIQGGVKVLDSSNNCNTLQGCMNLITSIAAKSANIGTYSQAQIEVGDMVFDVSGGVTDIGKQVFNLSDNVGQTDKYGDYSRPTKGVNFLKFQSRNVPIQTFFNILSTSLLTYIHALPDNISVLKNLQINYRDLSQNLVTSDLTSIDGALKYFNYLAYSGIAIGISGEGVPATQNVPTMGSQFIEIDSLVNLFIQMQYPPSDYARNKQYFPLEKLLMTSVEDIQINGGFIQMATSTTRPNRRMMYMTPTDRLEVIRAYYPEINSWDNTKKSALATYTNLLANSNALGDIENRSLALEVWYNTNSA